MFQMNRWVMLVVFGLALVSPAAAQRQPRRSPHGPLNIPCENCHTNTSWTPIRAVPEFNHDSTRYPLRGMHEKVSCTGCHTRPVFTDVGKNCAACHADIHRAQFGTNCAQCHTVLGWQVSVQSISQHFNRFPLLGAHAVVECAECHKNAAAGIFVGLSTECITCHTKDYQSTTNPPHVSAGPAFAASNCTTCHSFDTWANAKFDHNADTNFPLTGAHINTPCTTCHVNNNYTGSLPTTCGGSGCHLSTWQQTNNPPHQTAGPAFALSNCASCHNTTSWTTANFNHNTQTNFPLTGAHISTPCATCHVNNNYTGSLPTTCGGSGCHLSTWQQTNNPPHQTAGPTFALSNCASCHNTTSWTTAIFDHNTTAFPLQGAHTVPPRTCMDSGCHLAGNFAAVLPTTCFGCHTKDYNNTATVGFYPDNPPNHAAANFSTTCTQCHNMTTWTSSTFDHSVFFPLTNAHAVPPRTCTDVGCHAGGNYTTLPTTCYGCHTKDYNNTAVLGFYPDTPPNHAAANFSTTCTQCHNTSTWIGATFNHSTFFALTNAHAVPPLTCVNSKCHVAGNYTTVPTACSGCHLDAYNSTVTLSAGNANIPNHVSAALPMDCTLCHDTIAWTDAVFNHNNTTFPLTGAHVTTACSLCHVGPTGYSGNLPVACNGCHTKDYNNTATVGFYPDNPPNHITANFPTTCATCHNTTTWTAATFNHATFFPLTNAHAVPPLTCVNSKCHVAGNYTTVPTACSGCHLDAYNSTVTLSVGNANIPNHVSAAFPMDCTLCHDTISWADAVFNHNNTTFPLTGAHVTTSCSLCHVGPTGYSGNLPIACDGCHDALYQSTTNATAYVPPAPNHVALGYPKTCQNCHTTTTWLGAIFDHSTTGFPLVGAHITTACTLCHTSAAVPPTDCYSCHTAKWQSTATLGGSVPNHTAADASVAGITTAACASCHTPSGNWLDGKFTHSWFNMAHGNNAAGGVCTVCHTSASTTYTVFQCTVCHGNNVSANFHHPGVGGYVYNSVNCYACHSRG
jgi:hypothetical protein